MRGILRHQPTDGRRRARPRSLRRRVLRRRVFSPAVPPATERNPPSTEQPPATTPWSGASELDVARRVRAAGGPLDVASYTCSCGYTFAASVSTTVVCPHCGSEQAW